MNKTLRLLMLGSALAATVAFSGSALAFQTPAATGTKAAKAGSSKAAAMVAPSDKEIADAKAKGLVWVNLNSKVYHKDGEFYGKTKQGKLMAEADAEKAGYRAAKASGGFKKGSKAALKKN